MVKQTSNPNTEDDFEEIREYFRIQNSEVREILNKWGELIDETNVENIELQDRIDRIETELKVEIIKMNQNKRRIKEIMANLWNVESFTEKYNNFIQDSDMVSSSSSSMTEYLGVTVVESNRNNNNRIQEVWEGICSKGSILGDARSGSAIDKTQTAHFINDCIDIIVSEFGKSALSLHLNPPCLSHHQAGGLSNFVISPLNVNCPSWLDCLGFIQCATDTNFADSAGSAIDFGRMALVESTGTARTALEKTVRFSAVTDGRTIQFFVFFCQYGSTKKTCCTEVLDFFMSKRKSKAKTKTKTKTKFVLESSECSDGVKMLCQFIHLMTEQAVLLPSTIKLGNTDFPITSYLHRGADIEETSVCTINLDGFPCVVKYSEGGLRSNFSLKREFKMYKSLKRSGVRLLKMHKELSNNQQMVFTEVGETLKSWSIRTLFPGGRGVASLDDNKQLFLSVMRDVLEEITKFHKAGFTHGDIRPDNILVLDGGKACLIDFESSNRIKTPINSIYGSAMYIATNFVMKAKFPCFYLKTFDLESFLLTFLDCIAPDFFQMIMKYYKFTTGNDCEISPDLKDYRNDILDDIVEGDTSKLEHTKYDPELLKIFTEMYRETDGNLNDHSSSSKLKEILLCCNQSVASI